MQIHLQIAGTALMLLAGVHVIFPRYFRWKTELASLSLINRQMMQVHTFFIALSVFLSGWLCVSSADMLVQTPLGRRICLGLWIFWTCRLLVQFFGYSSALWKGKAFETSVHIVFSAFWVYLSWIFGRLALGE